MDHGLSGDSRPERLFAAGFDNLLSFLLVVCMAVLGNENFEKPESAVVNACLGFGLVVIYFAYFFLFEAVLSTTPGKMMFSLRVRHLDGSRCSIRAAFLRTLTRLLEVNPILLGGLPAAVIVRRSQRKQRWGDMLADTIVVGQR